MRAIVAGLTSGPTQPLVEICIGAARAAGRKEMAEMKIVERILIDEWVGLKDGLKLGVWDGCCCCLVVLLVWISSWTGSVEVYIDLFSPASFLSSQSIRAYSLDHLSLGPLFPQQGVHCYLFKHRDW
ncbi:hypothetical protein H106_06837 [Trichophyton rubrum CBS 735.88]|nr:hypothetical protein H106_06837 [Trichophyton rubrum CBS 735.88]